MLVSPSCAPPPQVLVILVPAQSLGPATGLMLLAITVWAVLVALGLVVIVPQTWMGVASTSPRAAALVAGAGVVGAVAGRFLTLPLIRLLGQIEPWFDTMGPHMDALASPMTRDGGVGAAVGGLIGIVVIGVLGIVLFFVLSAVLAALESGLWVGWVTAALLLYLSARRDPEFRLSAARGGGWSGTGAMIGLLSLLLCLLGGRAAVGGPEVAWLMQLLGG